VTFVQASVREPVPFGELSEAVRARHAEFAAHARRKYPDTVVIGPVRDALAATVKVVRDWDPTSGNARALPLAEQFPEFARRRLDPAAINFEFSRCVNDGARELFRANLTVAAFVAARDVWDRGGNLDQAYVYLHTIVPETADHFAGQLPFEVVERLPGGHVILRRRLRDLIDELAPERVFADFRRAGEMLGISRSSDLAEFLHRARGLDWGDYDVVRADGRREGRLHWLAEKTLVRSRVRALLGRFSRYPLDLDRVLEYLDRSELKSWSRDPGPGDGVVRASLDAWLEGRTTYDAQAVAFGEKYLRDLVEAAGPGATRESAEAAFRALRFRFDGDGAEEGLARAMQGKVRRTRSLRLQLTGEQLLARMKRRVRRGEAITLEPRGAHVGSTDAILPFFRPAKPKGIRAPTR
jgi:hypothetical protein